VRCECGNRKVPIEEACSSCLDKDGRTAEERDVISALRVHGGHAMLASIVEDMAGSIHEAHNGAGHRRAYRGLARLRERGLITSVAEFSEPMPHSGGWTRLQAKRNAARELRRKRPARASDGQKTPGGGLITYSLRGSR
jgi:hypothetical protein